MVMSRKAFHANRGRHSLGRMTDLEIAFRKIVADIVREELHVALSRFNEQSPDPGRRYVSAAQAATIANVSQGTIRVWIRQGRLHEYRAGRVLRISIDDLHAFMEAKPAESEETPEELAVQFVERRTQEDKTRCPQCRHLPSWHLHDGCRAKNFKCKRRMY